MEKEDKSVESPVVESSDNRLSSIIEDESELALEALLFASPDPLTEKEIAKIIGRKPREIPSIVEQLNAKYSEWGRSFRIEHFGSKFRFYTLPELDPYIARLADIPRPVKLSQAALEVLSIVAYKQPAVKAEIERIRGINSDGVIRNLMERNLVEMAGRSDGPGRPMLYKTTQEFLEFFGISDLSELPQPEIPESESEIAKSLTLMRSPENGVSSESSDEVE
jgi:segregation and condensation protein B